MGLDAATVTQLSDVTGEVAHLDAATTTLVQRHPDGRLGCRHLLQRCDDVGRMAP